MRRISSLLIAAFIAIPSLAFAGPPDSWRRPAADVIAWFETSGGGYGSLTPDFDCQGLSAGVLQWNVGKKSLWNDLLKNVPATAFTAQMPTYGEAFRDALAGQASEGLAYVRKFQTFGNPDNCESNRNAKWTIVGKQFAKEVSALMQSEPVVALQRAALNTKLDQGWDFATWWAESRKGKGAQPTYTEFVVFSDTLNFNGKWTDQANYAKVKDLRRGRSDQEVLREILEFLAAAPDGQYQQFEAKKNAKLWATVPLDDEKLYNLTSSCSRCSQAQRRLRHGGNGRQSRIHLASSME